MFKAGFIGLGNMGAALAAGLLNGGGISPRETVFANRTPAKAQAVADRYPGVTIARDNMTAADSDIVFVTVRSDQLTDVLREISPAQGVHIVVVNGGIPLTRLESICGGPVSKLIPSVTMEHGRGASLVCHGPSVRPEQARVLEEILSSASQVHLVPEDHMDVAADLTSCGPALIAEMADQLAKAGLRRRGIDPQVARAMVLETLMGTALALTEGQVTIEELRSRVATKGGITEEGLKVLQRCMPEVLDEVMDRTLAKQELVRARVDAQFIE